VFQAAGGREAVYYVVPLLGAAAVWATYLIGKLLAGATAGALGSILLLASPAFLVMLIQPMSDVPVTALWAGAMIAAWRGTTFSALAGGVLASMAILTRPNLVPLAALVGLIAAAGPGSVRARVRRGVAYSLAVAPSIMIIAVLNAYWHGSPLRSGYGPFDYLYSLERVGPNLRRYGAWLLETETPIVLLAAAVPVYLRQRGVPSTRLVITTVMFPLVVLGLYVPYLVFDDWTYLRFLLPAYPVLLAATAAVLLRFAMRPRFEAVSPLLIALLVTAVAVYGAKLAQDPVFGGMKEAERRYLLAARYAQTLPRPAVLAALHHSGSLHYYTDHDVLRWDLFDPAYIDSAIEYLRGRRYNLYLFIDEHEMDQFRRRFHARRILDEIDRGVRIDLPGDVHVYPLGGTERPPHVR